MESNKKKIISYLVFNRIKLQNYIKIFVKIILWIKIFNTELYYYEKFFI